MTSQYFHSNINDIVPFQATYTWPSQSTKVHKQTVKLQPKSGFTFGPRQKIRFEFPSDGYLNTQQSRLTFDLTVTSSAAKVTKTDGFSSAVANAGWSAYPTGTNASSRNLLFVTALGLTLTADAYKGYVVYVPRYQFTSYVTASVEATKGYEVNQIILALSDDVTFSTSGLEVVLLPGVHLGAAGAQELFQVERVQYGGTVLEEIRNRPKLARGLHELGVSQTSASSQGTMTDGRQGGYVGDKDDAVEAASSVVDDRLQSMLACSVTYRYSLPLMSGLFNCNKLIPLKWLAAQWSLELETGTPEECLITSLVDKSNSNLTFSLTNVQFIAELLEFPDTYDTAFYVGLSNGGVPIKFNTWRYHTFNLTGTTNHMQIHERARSIKAAYAWVTDQKQKSRSCDKWMSFYKLNSKLIESNSPSGSSIATTSAAGVDITAKIKQYQYRIGGSYFPAQPVDCSNGGVEAYNELLKALDGMNDYTFSHNIRPSNWTGSDSTRSPGSKFCMALEFEHADVMPDTITGISGEEQSDIALQIDLTDPLDNAYGKSVDVFLAVDAMIVVGTGNTVKLIM